MHVHARAKLGPAGRFALTEAIANGMTQKAAAAAFCVAPATAHRWWHRRLAAGSEELRSGSWLCDRPSRPRRSPRLLDRELQERICECRRHTGWGPRLVAGATGQAHSTVWKVLRRHGISRPERAPKEPANRYEWPCPGDLLHMDTARYWRFERPGHAVTGDRSQRSRNWMAPETRVGVDFAQAATVTAFVERALAWFADQGITARRLMTDNAFSYVRNRSLRELLEARHIKHLRTQAYRPRTNGKVERFHQTMAREWGYGLAYRSHRHRNQALPHWLAHYNQRRPHSSIGGQPPISRVHNVRGQDS